MVSEVAGFELMLITAAFFFIIILILWRVTTVEEANEKAKAEQRKR